MIGKKAQSMQVQRRVRYQEELDPKFGHEVAAQPGGEDLFRCLQCGTCSATCPLNIYMDHGPRKVIAMTRAGFREDVLTSNTIWLCASCYACTVDCPKQIKITDVMYLLKQEAIRGGVHPPRHPIPVLAKEFFGSVVRTGRSNEGRIITKMFLKTNPFNLLKRAGLGMRLLAKGRMSVREERMGPGQAQLDKILSAVEQAD